MHLGAMIDVGVDAAYLLEELKKLGIEEYTIDIQTVQKKGIHSTKVTVNDTSHAHSTDSHHLRNLYDITRLIEESRLSTDVKELSVGIFKRLAEAEAKVHGTSIEKIHFHEVGAVDSIVDIVGSAICLRKLRPDRIISSPVQVGGGVVTCAHGVLPVPAPATAELLRDIPIRQGLVQQETTTPTGAAILASVVDEFRDSIDFTATAIGYGAGTRDFEIPNVLRVMQGSRSSGVTGKYDCEEEILIACNIDDMNPELYEPLLDMLFKHGAKDVYLTPIIMKKSRPAVTLHVLCPQNRVDCMVETVFYHSSTFGVRTFPVSKRMLKKQIVQIDTRYGPIRVKQGLMGESIIKQKPEYEDCRRASGEHNIPIETVYDAVQKRMADE